MRSIIITTAILLCSIGVFAQTRQCKACTLSEKYYKAFMIASDKPTIANKPMLDSLYYNAQKWNLECQRITIEQSNVIIKNLTKMLGKSLKH